MMLAQLATAPAPQASIALVDGDASVRRNRLLMLRAENFEVRSYATCAAIIADPNARRSACLVVDVDVPEIGGVELLRTMRGVGWLGSGILLQAPSSDDAATRSATAPGDTVLPKAIADRPLLDAIRLAVTHHRAA